jgi:hypothetical protein
MRSVTPSERDDVMTSLGARLSSERLAQLSREQLYALVQSELVQCAQKRKELLRARKAAVESVTALKVAQEFKRRGVNVILTHVIVDSLNDRAVAQWSVVSTNKIDISGSITVHFAVRSVDVVASDATFFDRNALPPPPPPAVSA